MKVSENGIALIKQFEGCRLKAYKDVGGVLTIGYGHTKNVKQGMIITELEADKLLKEDIKRFEDHVDWYNKIYDFNQNQFDALVSFAFNIGNISGLTINGTRTINQIASKIPEYCKVNKTVVKGLQNRRAAELKLFLLPVQKYPFEVGKTYTLIKSLAVRKGPAVSYELVGYDKLTADAKKHDANKNGYLDQGTKVTCKAIVSEGSNIWIKIPSGYIAAVYDNNIYIK